MAVYSEVKSVLQQLSVTLNHMNFYCSHTGVVTVCMYMYVDSMYTIFLSHHISSVSAAMY